MSRRRYFGTNDRVIFCVRVTTLDLEFSLARPGNTMEENRFLNGGNQKRSQRTPISMITAKSSAQTYPWIQSSAT